MTMSASIECTSGFDIVRPNEQISFMLAVQNSSAATVTVTEITPQLTPLNSAATAGEVGLNGGLAVAAASTSYFPFHVCFYGPQANTTSTSVFEYTVGATVQSDDGSVFSAPPITVDVGPSTAASPTDQGNFDGSSPLDSGAFAYFFF